MHNATNLADTDDFILAQLLRHQHPRIIRSSFRPAAIASPWPGSSQPMPCCAPESATARISPGVAKMLKIISPEAVVVSMPPSLRERNPTPLHFNYSTISIRFRSDLPSRSSRQTIRVSPSLSSLRQAFKPGRSVFEPLAWSV